MPNTKKSTFKAGPPPPTTSWPESAPADDEPMIFSISCGNTHLHWATHFGAQTEFAPKIFWRTPHLSDEDMNNDPLAILSRNLPDDPHDFIFGGELATAQAAQEQSSKRTSPKISVYVVSSNASQAAKLAKIWSTVPSRFYIMRGDDFFKKSEGRYDTMGTDRLATLTGATYLYGAPALVFDGGTATTYSATDYHGNILGGGIGPGLQSKFRSLSKNAEALPQITPEEVVACVQEAQEKGKPLKTFATDTRKAMMVDAFQEFALKGRNVVEHWLEKTRLQMENMKMGKGVQKLKPGMKVNESRHVCCTGGDGEILQILLQPCFGGVLELYGKGISDVSGNTKGNYQVEVSKHLVHYGVAAALLAQVVLRKKGVSPKKAKSNEKLAFTASFVGRRVAKLFDVEDDDGDNIYRGEVVGEIQLEGGGKEYQIKYDDGDKEDVSFDDLTNLISLYEEHGEKKKKKSKPATPTQRTSNGDISAAVSGKSKPKSSEKKKKPEQKKSTNGDAKKRAAPTSDSKPAAKKAKTEDVSAFPESQIRKRVAKDFDGDTYFGTVMSYDDSDDPPLWHVEYDDGDEEDYAKKDLVKALKHYEKHEKEDPSR